MKRDLQFNCVLEPEDKRNFIRIEDMNPYLSITVQHVAYGFWYRLRCAFKMLFKGYDANDITIAEADAFHMSLWIYNWFWNNIKNEYNEEAESKQ